MATERFVESSCACGQAFLIEHGAPNTFRRDGKRIFYSHNEEPELCAFRCRTCRMPVHETVPGAEFASAN